MSGQPQLLLSAWRCGPQARERSRLHQAVLRWAASILRCGDVTVVCGMREGGSRWLLHDGEREVVLRVGRSDDMPSFRTEVAALSLAGQIGAPAPRPLAHDDGTATGSPLVLTERLAGSSTISARTRPGPAAHAGRRRRAAARHGARGRLGRFSWLRRLSRSPGRPGSDRAGLGPRRPQTG
ncbi:MAG TPA: hypothetical protein DEH11_12240 [Actinobacteria bacterium]|nr:hypothetical protein [Actinomycetota bacterium]